MLPVSPLSDGANEPVRVRPKPVRVVCLVGHHKSGSTVLGTILGTLPGTFYAGELYRFPSTIWAAEGASRLCSCGVPVPECPLWSKVRSRCEPSGLTAALRGDQKRFERWASLPRTMLRSAGRDSDLRDYARRMVEFVGIIAEVTGSGTVLDQCQNSLRARLYQAADPGSVDVRYLHIVRDGRGFLFTELAMDPRVEPDPPWTWIPLVIIGRWVMLNFFATVLGGLDARRYLRVRYEDLMADPAATILRIGTFLGVDATEAARRVGRGEPVPVRHVAAANRLRLSGPVLLRRDERWMTGLARKYRMLFWLFAGWLAHAYGYRRQVPSR